MVDEAYADRTEWIKKSIRTTAKVHSFHYTHVSFAGKTANLNTR